MAHSNRFVIQNDSPVPLTLDIEPEGARYSLSRGEAISVSDVYTSAPVTIEVTSSAQGGPILSIWPGDGEVRVEKDGVDIYELVPQASGSIPESCLDLASHEAAVPLCPPRE